MFTHVYLSKNFKFCEAARFLDNKIYWIPTFTCFLKKLPKDRNPVHDVKCLIRLFDLDLFYIPLFPSITSLQLHRRLLGVFQLSCLIRLTVILGIQITFKFFPVLQFD